MSRSGGDVWTIQRILTWTQGSFAEHGIDTARLDAELLLADTLAVDRVYLYTHYDKPLSAAERTAFRERVRRRANREPVAYILGRREMFSRSFKVTPDVLIPRPETEHLVEQVLAWCERQQLHNPRIADIGTGSGCIAVTLACELPEAQVVATDVSAAALAVARENAAAHGVTERIEMLEGDLFAPLAGRTFDVVVSNPPYVEATVRPSLQPEVRDFEPEVALFAGDDGMAVLEPLCDQVAQYLATPGVFACEMDPRQVPAVRERLEAAGAWSSIDVVNDLQGLARAVVAQR